MHLFAYLDPGTGSIIIQALIGTVVGVAVLVKTYWLKIVSLFKRGSKDKKTPSKDLRN